ncbi:11502_t:CDS:2, partial [Dentiscutata heterogama]
FWVRTGFVDPYTKLEQEDFAKCDYECSDEIHQKSIDGLLLEKSYCDLQLFHDLCKTLPPGKKGYLSNYEHVFLCRDPRVAAFHIIFVLDQSESMSCKDHPPTSDTLFGKALVLQEAHNNRFVLFENQSIFDTDFIQNKLIEKKGTRFDKAIIQTEQIIDKHFDISRLNVVIFLSDGLDRLPENILKNMCQKNKEERGSPLFLNTIHFGGSNDEFGDSEGGAEVLKKMAEIAQTFHDNSFSNNVQCKFVKAPDTIQLIDNFTDVATNLLVYKPILIKK